MLTKIEKISPLSAFAINNIKSSENTSMDFLSFREKLSLANIGHPQKRKEWKAARLAIKNTLDSLSLPYPGFYKDNHGKSHAMDDSGHVSLTHHGDYAAAIFHREMSVGIDLERVRDKTVPLGPKYLDPSEMEFLGSDPFLYTLAWSVKESIYKCQGKKGISLRQNIILEPFTAHDKIIKGKIYGSDFSDHHYQVMSYSENDMILTYTVW
ncbi:4'-phosphopantetheinyl transferase family protein [Cyclobacterium marinum]|uniref:4'-phosphopantetheinyl transferase n=1 Tax=Cyclobacterium marinum (strain ATCC 25205 / DSM 745 / LMG 13164 / NCIMB 1802) TaxID=880070 RepID=G0IYG2_CYCMS|nr:4'-phosphopantetheinyl transferase superfamily protein [Cyclobacterium marinum]AEL26385.1 4'-phosphopantetheinyl transferase [Cyclobacterium marinum DSM 745]MBI0399726.1 4'-phosphopantetheinyl transferase superfamily protein [Cyclobacterium marinum]MBR9774077.1 4'-phosphopantetheinyl transferase superfamily protein [Cytophagales bacterium]|tara:strand:- start:41865 stop:42494 length:630 start_codon:yes stop_codon:yes gene_type:complete